MSIIFNVDCAEGEESNWLSDVSREELNLLNPLLKSIKEHDGYFPTGKYRVSGEPTVEDIYGCFPGFQIINRFLPTPLHGFKKIKTVYLFEGQPLILDLV